MPMGVNTTNKTLFQILFLTVIVLFASCSEQRQLAKGLKNQFKESKVVGKYHVGFALYDLKQNKSVYTVNEHKYFTPASNTKLFTFYGSLLLLPEYLPALKYIETPDSLIFWGTGDPSFLHSELQNVEALEFLKDSDKKLFYAPGRYTGSFYGAGWQWDDYNDYYQAEINELPIQDNLVKVKYNQSKGLEVSPKLFENNFKNDTTEVVSFKIVRDFNKNEFVVPTRTIKTIPDKFTQQIPYKIDVNTTIKILSDTLQRSVGITKKELPEDAITIMGISRDTVLKQMLLPSDNFIAEQLLLLCSDALGTELNTQKTIDYIVKNHLQSLPDKPIWIDGSGLSRYNLFTPADMVEILKLLYQLYNNDSKLFDMLPAGGKTGTLKNAYPATNNPFVFGKTGTVSNNHNQSGFVVTKKGKVYAYSFMNNNFVIPTSEVRKEMAKIVTYIHDNY